MPVADFAQDIILFEGAPILGSSGLSFNIQDRSSHMTEYLNAKKAIALNVTMAYVCIAALRYTTRSHYCLVQCLPVVVFARVCSSWASCCNNVLRQFYSPQNLRPETDSQKSHFRGQLPCRSCLQDSTPISLLVHNVTNVMSVNNVCNVSQNNTGLQKIILVSPRCRVVLESL